MAELHKFREDMSVKTNNSWSFRDFTTLTYNSVFIYAQKITEIKKNKTLYWKKGKV